MPRRQERCARSEHPAARPRSRSRGTAAPGASPSVPRGPEFRRDGSEAGPVGSAARGEQSRVSGARPARVMGPNGLGVLEPGNRHCRVRGRLTPWAPAGRGTWALWLLELRLKGSGFPEIRPRAELPALEAGRAGVRKPDPGPSAVSSCVRARPPSCCLTLSPRTGIQADEFPA